MPKQDQKEAGFLNQQTNPLLKPVTTMYTFLLLHKHGEHDDTSTHGAQQQGWDASLEWQRELLVNGEPRSASDSVYCSSLVLTRCFLCASMRDFNRVLMCQKPSEDRLMQECWCQLQSANSRNHSVPSAELATKTAQCTWGCQPEPLQQPPPPPLPSLA